MAVGGIGTSVLRGLARRAGGRARQQDGRRGRLPPASSGPRRRPSRPDGGSGFGVGVALFSLGERTVFKWMVFFVLILAAILAFVSWVMGVPIPGLDGLQQNPFNQ